MKRSFLMQVGIVTMVLTACAYFPIGLKRTFNNWEVTPSSTSSTSPTPPTAIATVTPMATSPLPTVATTTLAPTAMPSPEATIVEASAIEFVYPAPQPFTLGKTSTEFGIQINGCDKDVSAALAMVKRMGLTWIKQQARWADIEASRGTFDWACLDRVIPAADNAGLKVLISVTTSPAYARQPYVGIMHPTNGRPADFRDLALFLANLIARYPKQIQAIEVWNEPNLMREWGDVIDGGAYAQMLAAAYGVIKYLDPNIMVISAGLAPTGFNDEWEAVDDAPFLKGFFDYQGSQYADCIGAHANGPDNVGEIHLVAEHHFELTSRTKAICVTEFGYALPVDGQAPTGFEWIMPHTPDRQAQVLPDGLRWARQSGFTQLVILWNLNFNGSHDDPNAPYALVRPQGTSPAVDAIAREMRAP